MLKHSFYTKMQHFKSLKNYLSNATSSNNFIDTTSNSNSSRFEEIENKNDNETPNRVQLERGASSNGIARKSSNSLFNFSRSFATVSSSKQSKKSLTNRLKFMRSSNGRNAELENIETKVNKINDSEPQNINNLSKRQLLNSSELKTEVLFEWLNTALDDLISHFKQESSSSYNYANTTTNNKTFAIKHFLETSEASSVNYFKLTSFAKSLLSNCLVLYYEVEKNAHLYDFDENLKSNGYRSLLRTFESCSRRMLKCLNDLNDKKSGFLFQFKLSNANLPLSNITNSNLKELQTWVKLMERIESFLQVSVAMQAQQLATNKNNNSTYVSQSGLQGNEIGPFHDGPSLYLHSHQLIGTHMEVNLIKLGSLNLDVYFGRACGFQFADSLVTPLTGVAVALASYNDGFEYFVNKENNFSVSNSSLKTQSTPDSSDNSLTDKDSASMSENSVNNTAAASVATTSNKSMFTLPLQNNSLSNTLGQAAKSLFSSTKYIMDPDLRSKKISYVMKNANVEFCKAFWQLIETSIVQMGSNLITPTLAVNITKNISLGQVLKVPSSINSNELVEIMPPHGATANDFLKIRVLSHEMRKGMEDFDKVLLMPSVEPNTATFSNDLQYSSFTNQIEKSKYLILHAHGGGFIAHSSKSHEIYLKPWSKELKIPIVSIDYSLSPEVQFPRASEECFYAYAWCLLNKDMLGWTGEKIICVGDSAGGLLVTNIVQRAILSQIRIPDVLVPIYAPFLCTYSLSPSKLLSIMDPLLNYGILWRCLAAYCGIDFKTESENFKHILNMNNHSTLKTSSSSSSSKQIMRSDSEISIKYSKSFSVDNFSKTAEEKSFKSIEERVVIDNGLAAEMKIEQQSFGSSSQSSADDIRLLTLHKLMGDGVFLIEKLRNHSMPHNQFISPLLMDDKFISQFPTTCLITASDPFLDDNIELAKRLKKLGVKIDVLIVDNGTPHGFLNMKNLSEETADAAEEVLNVLKEIISEFELNGNR